MEKRQKTIIPKRWVRNEGEPRIILSNSLEAYAIGNTLEE